VAKVVAVPGGLSAIGIDLLSEEGDFGSFGISGGIQCCERIMGELVNGGSGHGACGFACLVWDLNGGLRG
jgi:hypothetical protein